MSGIDRRKYITVMFPYPSGASLHIGHWYNYAIVDSYCKIQKYLGYEVFQPFGFDSFGLPTENYAKKMGLTCEEATELNINSFNKEMERMNTGFEYKFSTHSKEYQKKTQSLFNKLKEHGLVYKANREQNYCTSCETTISNEQVENGNCERCGTEIIQKEMNQFFIKITDYKERLIADLDKITIPKASYNAQKNWLLNLEDWCVSRQRSWGCPIPIEGETDTLDTFVDSSFYTIEYDKTRPVDVYVGGIEHTTKHIIYSRFICKFLYDIGEVDFDEPFKEIVHQGMILGEDGVKMSKSRGNTINPTEFEPIALRMFLMFINHFNDGGMWSTNGYKGCVRFINRINTYLKTNVSDITEIDEEEIDVHIMKCINYFNSWKVNKVVSEWMIFYNNIKGKKINIDQKNKIEELFKACF